MRPLLAISEDLVAPNTPRAQCAYRVRLFAWWWTATLLCSIAAPTTHACRYNVRDVGFTDLDSEQYRLRVLVQPSTSPAAISRLKSAAERVLQDSNVRLEMASFEASGPNATPKSLRPSSTAWPDLVLESPDGPTLTLPSGPGTTEASPAWETILESMVASPIRDRLLESVSQTFAAILLVDGIDTAANERARATIGEAIEQTRAQMRTLPKTIAKAPELVRLNVASLVSEATLLWSLSLKPEPTVHPRALVLYGRLRWIGPVMNGAEITTRNLVGLLSMIGADCECGLDLQWTLGTRIPTRWTDRTHARAVKGLGFDPENPVVKAEISAILERRRPDTEPKSHLRESPEPARAVAPMHARKAQAPAGHATAPITTAAPSPDPDLATPLAWLALSALVGCVILGAGILVRRARRQQSPD